MLGELNRTVFDNQLIDRLMMQYSQSIVYFIFRPKFHNDFPFISMFMDENKNINIIYLMTEQCGQIFLSKIDLFQQKLQNGVFDF